MRFLRARAAIPILGSSAATACKPPGARFPQLEPKEQPHGQRPHQRRRQEVKGAIKETAGKLTGNRQTEIEGKAEKAVGKVQRNVGEARTRSATLDKK